MAQAQKDVPDFKSGVASAKLDEGGMLGGTCGGDKVLVVRKQGKLCALSGECTHLGADLSTGALTGTSLRCPWHHARFDIETGEAVGAPAFEPLTRFEVSERDGRIVVGQKLEPIEAKKVALDRRVVIVGAGAGGHACAEWLARRGAGGSVTLIGDENTAPYDRTFCSKQILAGKKSVDDAALAPLPGVRVISGTAVTAIDRDARSVTLANGNALEYDALVLATGAAPVEPEFMGSDKANVHLLRTIDDARAILETIRGAKHAAVIGASFIGLEVASSLQTQGLSVTVIAPDSIPLAGKFGDEVGHFVQTLHEDHQVVFKLEREVQSFDGKQLTLDDGSKIRADVVVVGIGVEPRLELVKSAGLELAAKTDGGGVQVSDQLLTSDPHIYAIGDIASFTDARLGSMMRVEHWVVAQRQGQFVARHLLGEADRYVDTPFFWSGHYDQSLHYIGHGKPDSRKLEGSVEDGDFLVTYVDGKEAAARLSYGRDQALLQTEAEWDAEVLGTDTEFGGAS